MRLSAKSDVEAPAEFVFRMLSDFDAWERFAMRRGADVTRTDKMTQPGVGMGWLARFRFRSKMREARITLKEMNPDGVLGFSMRTPNLDGEMRIEVVDMTARRARLHVECTIEARTLGARLFLQSMRLAKGRVDRKYAQKIGQLARELEKRHAGSKA